MYFAFGSICGNTLVSDAAASTVGWVAAVVAVVLAGALAAGAAVAGRELVVDELLLPQPAASAAPTIPIAKLRRTVPLITRTLSFRRPCQNAGSLP